MQYSRSMFGSLIHLLVFSSVALATDEINFARNASWETLTTHDGRVADAYVPACVHADSPILVSFHGLGFKKEQQPTYDRFYLDAERECAVIVYPQGKFKAPSILGWAGYSWNAGGCCPTEDVKQVDDVAFIDELIPIVANKYGANGNLVFAAGISNGAMMANRYGCSSSRVKGVIAVAGPLVNGSGGDGGEKFHCSRPVPTLYFHGTRDPICPLGGCNATWSSFGHICQSLYKLGPGISADGIPSVAEFLDYRRTQNGIKDSVGGIVNFQNKSVTCTSWGSTANNVTFCKLTGMGHAWPGKDTLCMLPWTTCDDDISATHEAWRFINELRPAPAIVV